MKKIYAAFVLLMITITGHTQLRTPVKWNFTVSKINSTSYEVHITAVLDGSWHIYSQSTPAGGPVKTTIRFTSNPLINIVGIATEKGKLQQKHEPLFGVDVKQYAEKVDFIQIIKLKAPVKTNLIGQIEYMVCNDRECLPPTVEKFSLPIQ